MYKKITVWASRLSPSVIAGSISAGAILFAATANGANGTIVSAPTNIITQPSDIVTLFCTGLTWLFWGLLVLAVVMFLVGGYTYATSQGDSEKVGKATKTLTYAAIALVVGLAAAGVPILIGSFLGVSSTQLTACS